MRVSSSFACGAVLMFGVVCGGVLCGAQDQPAAGSPPPAQTAQAPAQTQQAPDQNAAPAQTQPQQDQNAAPEMDDALPPPPIDARRGPNPQKQAKMLAKRLGLTADQQADVELVLANRVQRMRKARTDVTLAPPDRKALVREINRDSLRRINAVLTAEQRQEYKQFRQEQRAKRQEQREQQQTAAQAPAGDPQ